eukprot:SAG31_NODE_929_length_10926_cov_8.162834_13_plen_320_part_00
MWTAVKLSTLSAPVRRHLSVRSAFMQPKLITPQTHPAVWKWSCWCGIVLVRPQTMMQLARSHGYEQLLCQQCSVRLLSSAFVISCKICKICKISFSKIISGAQLEPFKCLPCGKMQFDQRDWRQLLGCGHRVCLSCLRTKAVEAAASVDGVCPHPPCPVPGCSNAPDPSAGTVGWLGPAAAKELLPAADYERWLQACLDHFTEQEKAADTFVRCPECLMCFTRVAASAEPAAEPAAEFPEGEPAVEEDVPSPTITNAQQLIVDALGNKRELNETERAHFDEHRFRCPNCTASFCRLCDQTPYHSEPCSEFALNSSDLYI